jgi:hypothetical protein
MGSHIQEMKTTIEIADDLFERAQKVARREKTTFRALTEQGLRLVLSQKQAKSARWEWRPCIVDGEGMAAPFKGGGWETVRDTIYGGRGA